MRALLSIPRNLAALFLTSSFLLSCTTVEHYWTYWTQFREKPFQASDRVFFPNFIHEFFPKAEQFERYYSSIKEARHGFKIVEIKRLNDKAPHYSESNLAWSANGAYFSYEIVDQRKRQILLKSLGRGLQRELTELPRGRDDFLSGMVRRQILSYNSGLSWSHDSRMFAFMSNGGMGFYNIYLGNLDSSSTHVLTEGRHKNGLVSWNPKQHELAFVSSRSGSGDLYTSQLNQSEPTQLTHSPHTELFPEWLPSGEAIAFSSGNANRQQIMLIQRKDQVWQTPRQLTNWNRNDLRPKSSPCGQWIAFYSSDPDSQRSEPVWNLSVIRSSGKIYQSFDYESTVIARDIVVDLNTGPAWSPDGQKIFYIKRNPQAFNPIEIYNLVDGSRHRLHSQTKMNRDLIVSPLGVLSFRAQVGAWDQVFLALTNQGVHLQSPKHEPRGLAFVKTITDVHSAAHPSPENPYRPYRAKTEHENSRLRGDHL